MAKDAHGHGSNGRGGMNGIQIAPGARFSGQKLAPKAYSDAARAVADVRSRITNQQAAGALAQGGAKSAPAPVHSGTPARNWNFTDNGFGNRTTRTTAGK